VRLRDTLAALASVLLFASTAGATPPAQPSSAPGCVPGVQVQCACPGGATGIQVCSGEGSRFEACACAPAPVVQASVTMPTATRRANPGLWKAGITLMVLGEAGVAVGIALGSAGEGCSESHEGLCVTGGIIGVVAATLLVTGLPLAMIGGKRVPVHGPATGRDWTPSFVTAPGGGGVRWTF